MSNETAGNETPGNETPGNERSSTMDLPSVEEQPWLASRAEPPAHPHAPTLRGPSPWTVLHGLIALALAVLVFITTATTTRIDWATAGPATIVGLGVVLVLLGLLGMRRRRGIDA
ncbi:MAG: hypothetical protein ABI131_10875 [Nostocoides sp.]